MEEVSVIARIQKLMKYNKVQRTLQRGDRTYTDTPVETLQELIDVLFPETEKKMEANVENHGQNTR